MLKCFFPDTFSYPDAALSRSGVAFKKDCDFNKRREQQREGQGGRNTCKAPIMLIDYGINLGK